MCSRIKCFSVEFPGEVGFAFFVYCVKSVRWPIDKTVFREFRQPTVDIVVISPQFGRYRFWRPCPILNEEFENLVISSGHPTRPFATHLFNKAMLRNIKLLVRFVFGTFSTVLSEIMVYLTVQHLDLCRWDCNSEINDCFEHTISQEGEIETGSLGTRLERSLTRPTTMYDNNRNRQKHAETTDWDAQYIKRAAARAGVRV